MAARLPLSLGYRTDLFFARWDGEVLDRGDYFVVRTPQNPGFTWGNFLLFRDAPTRADLDERSPRSWPRLFERELSHCAHRLLAWDRTDGARGAVDAVVQRSLAH